MKRLAIIAGILCLAVIYGQSAPPPVGLRTDLMEHTDRVYIDGAASQLTLEQAGDIVERYQTAHVGSTHPTLSWQMEDNRNGILQNAFEVEVSSTPSFEEPIWSSGKKDGATPQIKYAGGDLTPSTIYYWRVKVLNNLDEWSEWSAIKAFKTASLLAPYSSGYYPITKSEQGYKTSRVINNKVTLYDFEKAAFGRVKLTVDSAVKGDTLTIRLGECITPEGRIDSNPGGSRRYREIELALLQGVNSYYIAIEKDERNSKKGAILMPQYIGEVYPFRYCEVEGANRVEIESLTREVVNYPFDDHSSHFESADTLLNSIWNLCKYSIKATSFAGLYVDGDRERIPYEADVYINQMCHYGVDSEYTLARRTSEYLIFNPTWPTEWILTSVLHAWSDYLYSGNPDFIEHYFGEMEKKCLTSLLDDNGLISTTTGKLTTEVKRSVNYTKRQKMRDIVDWPHKGTLGLSGDDSGETDGFEFTHYNCVVNAYFNKALRVTSTMAAALGEEQKSREYAAMAEEHYKAFNSLFFDKTKGYYTDGIDTKHSSLHANMFALAFDMVPQKYVNSVRDFVKSRGMACSVYGSQHLLDAVYAGEDAQYGMQRLTSKEERGWYHAIYNIGTTITLEAWDNKYKPNQDWNHAWGAAPANIIPMRLMGIQPLTAGFGKVRIKPQPASLEWAKLRYPTIRGEIGLSFKNSDTFSMELTIPANMEAEVWIPSAQKGRVMVNGAKHIAKRIRDFYVIESLPSGEYSVEVVVK